MLYLLVFSLGLTALLVAVGLFSGTLASLPRAGRWTVWVKRAGGVIMLGMAEYYLVQMGKRAMRRWTIAGVPRGRGHARRRDAQAAWRRRPASRSAPGRRP